MSILSDCLDKDWCSTITNETGSIICSGKFSKRAQAECPEKCHSYPPKDHSSATPGINCNVIIG